MNRCFPDDVTLPAVKNILPDGDFRQWDLIDACARELAGEIAGKVAMGWASSYRIEWL